MQTSREKYESTKNFCHDEYDKYEVFDILKQDYLLAEEKLNYRIWATFDRYIKNNNINDVSHLDSWEILWDKVRFYYSRNPNAATLTISTIWFQSI